MSEGEDRFYVLFCADGGGVVGGSAPARAALPRDIFWTEEDDRFVIGL